MPTQLDAISEAIGRLRGDVRALSGKLDLAERNVLESNRRADEHRATIHRRVDDLVGNVDDLARKVDAIETTVNDSKAVTDEVKLWKQRGVGALFVAGIAGSALGGTVIGFVVYWWDEIMRILRAA